ncbi:hypothetical protein [Streptococcus ruminantium]|uniref:Uncharacterized protein n=1 Tax=Streptococcus ruminantium TaxID=1917441 RepID=A0A2Z5U210_9STRE|nr:hypothetical protein [Streptococcus ruminantium]BBA91718.1 hypothetical protein SR187_0355 [Streptococcus ruminantium]
MISNIIAHINIKLFSLILLAGYCFLLVNYPEKVDSFFAKFSVSFLVTFTIVNELVTLVYGMSG